MPAGGSRSSAALFPAQTAFTKAEAECQWCPNTVQACDKGLVLLSDMWSLACGSPRRSPTGSMGRVAVHLAVAPPELLFKMGQATLPWPLPPPGSVLGPYPGYLIWEIKVLPHWPWPVAGCT